MSLKDFFINDEDIIVEENKTKERKEYERKDRGNVFYVYIYLNQCKPGKYVYVDLVFGYEPFYIGKGFDFRYYEHLKEADSCFGHPDKIKKCSNPRKIRTIHQIYNKCGEFPIIIKIRENLTDKEAQELERTLISLIGRKDKKLGPLTNLTDGGEGVSGRIFSEEERKLKSEKGKGRIVPPELKEWLSKILKGHEVSSETKQKMSENHADFTGEKNPNFGAKSQTPEVRKKMSECKKGKTQQEIQGLTDEEYIKYRKKMSEKYSGGGNHMYGKESAMKGKTHTPESKQKMSISHKGRKKSEKEIERLKNNIWIYNKELNIQKMWKKDQPIPDGWVRGGRPKTAEETEKNRQSNSNKIIIYNETLNIQKKINKNEPIPEGFRLGGRKGHYKHSPETKMKLSEIKKNKGKNKNGQTS